jgi:ubiquitin carboxyl-terminal hydrolase 2
VRSLCVTTLGLHRRGLQVAVRFLGYDQQDAQEFLRFLLDAIHEDTNRITEAPPYEELKETPADSNAKVPCLLPCFLLLKTASIATLSPCDMPQLSEMWWRNYCLRNDSFIKDLFCGQLRSSVVCRVCGFVSRCFDPFWDLSVPIPKTAQLRGHGSCAVEDCLQAFVTPELLTGSDSWYCSNCKTHTESQKTMNIYRCPVVLVRTSVLAAVDPLQPDV